MDAPNTEWQARAVSQIAELLTLSTMLRSCLDCMDKQGSEPVDPLAEDTDSVTRRSG